MDTQAPQWKVLYPLNRYDAGAYLRPYWTGRVMYHESVMPLTDAQGNVPDIPLLYHAEKILSLRSSDLAVEYVEGRDYQLEDGRLRIPKGSTIPLFPYEEYYPALPKPEATFPRADGNGNIFFSEGSVLHSRQLAVTYGHEDPYMGHIPVYQGDKLPGAIRRLQGGEPLRILVYGDSICTGANSSGKVGAAPFAPPWFDMLLGALRERYVSNRITLINTAVGGTASAWGAEHAWENAAMHRPDLAILGFGMNDGSGLVGPDRFEANMRRIVEAIRAANQDCEFILIATMLPNREVTGFFGLQEQYWPRLQAMTGPGTVLANMTQFHMDLLRKKRYADMTGNNVNHPNDFLARAYAQLLAKTLIDTF